MNPAMRPRPNLSRLQRRTLLLGSAASLLAVIGCDVTPTPQTEAERAPLQHAPGDGTFAYRLSTRGRRASNALKRHAANKRFATREAAEASIPYPTAPVRVVRITVSRRQFERWFHDRSEVDLRHPPKPPSPDTLKT